MYYWVILFLSELKENSHGGDVITYESEAFCRMNTKFCRRQPEYEPATLGEVGKVAKRDA